MSKFEKFLGRRREPGAADDRQLGVVPAVGEGVGRRRPLVPLRRGGRQRHEHGVPAAAADREGPAARPTRRPLAGLRDRRDGRRGREGALRAGPRLARGHDDQARRAEATSTPATRSSRAAPRRSAPSRSRPGSTTPPSSSTPSRTSTRPSGRRATGARCAGRRRVTSGAVRRRAGSYLLAAALAVTARRGVLRRGRQGAARSEDHHRCADSPAVRRPAAEAAGQRRLLRAHLPSGARPHDHHEADALQERPHVGDVCRRHPRHRGRGPSAGGRLRPGAGAGRRRPVRPRWPTSSVATRPRFASA